MSYYPDASMTGFTFRKSTFSGGNENCVEVAAGLPGETAVRDSKDPKGPALVYAAHAFTRFAEAVGTGSLVPVSN